MVVVELSKYTSDERYILVPNGLTIPMPYSKIFDDSMVIVELEVRLYFGSTHATDLIKETERQTCHALFICSFG